MQKRKVGGQSRRLWLQSFFALFILCHSLPLKADCWVATHGNILSPVFDNPQGALDWEMSAANRPECDVHADYVNLLSTPGELWWSDGLDHGAVPIVYWRIVASNTNNNCNRFNVISSNASFFGRITTLGGITYSIPDIYPQCRSQNYVVKLHRAQGLPVSDTILDKVEPKDTQSSASGKSVTQLVARVYDQGGQPVSNVNVELTVDVVQDSGGHKHDHSRNTTQMGLLASPQVR